MYKFFILMTFLLTLFACSQPVDDVINDNSQVLAEVGEKQITEAYLTAYLNSQGVNDVTEQQQTQALDALVKQFSLAHQAKKAGLELTQQQVFEIDQTKQQALAQLAIEQHLAANPVSDDDVRAEYRRITNELQGQEYHVRHLLYQDEVDALQVLDRIKAGLSYADAETEYLAANAQVKNVGDIGWVNIMQVPEVFRQPLQSMSVATVYPVTLLSQYGVHVLYLEDKRALVAPAFATVETGIRNTLRQRKINRYQQLAVIKAKAQIIKEK